MTVHTSNYDKYPRIRVSDQSSDCLCGWKAITAEISRRVQQQHKPAARIVIECYPGVHESEVSAAFAEEFREATIVFSSNAMLPANEINAFFAPDITEDELFGYLTRHTIDRFFDAGSVSRTQKYIHSVKEGPVIVIGVGAARLCPEADLLLYADLPRWEIQQRFRRREAGNIGVKNRDTRASLLYKRAFFVDWRICDRFKKKIIGHCDYVLDTHLPGQPKMITRAWFEKGLATAVRRPFRVVPFFDPGPWGGQWLREVCDLDREAVNFAWGFDCVPEENSLVFGFGDVCFELPAIDLVFAHPEELLGIPVYGRFGDEFPIRFDFLDTMQGGNLSLQVHPLTEYIRETFGMNYTQDESYYILEAGDDAAVYLGLKENIRPEEMIAALKDARKTGCFEAERFVGRYPVKKHDHILIPGGTVHCSGSNSVVLEISATPYIFTFKLWDWGRLGLDGRPRPINLAHGEKVIRWNRTESWVRRELLNRVELLREKDGVREERTGLHEQEFIETRRHRFSRPALHEAIGSVNVLNLVEGREALVESPDRAFEPFVVHYAETFIVPAAAGAYTVRPWGESEGKECATIKAFVRHHA
ncbi:MAG: class I mannose-6-phosphate isomerase [Tannerella sp.]|jgi:mannose-6-phosphate isomerase class I|nr:class I mannose-6-phosphate isomerase [Tannerella sp.]